MYTRFMKTLDSKQPNNWNYLHVRLHSPYSVVIKFSKCIDTFRVHINIYCNEKHHIETIGKLEEDDEEGAIDKRI